MSQAPGIRKLREGDRWITNEQRQRAELGVRRVGELRIEERRTAAFTEPGLPREEQAQHDAPAGRQWRLRRMPTVIPVGLANPVAVGELIGPASGAGVVPGSASLICRASSVMKKGLPSLFTNNARSNLATIDARVAALPRLKLAGNAYRGIGIPGSIHSGEAAVDDLLGLA